MLNRDSDIHVIPENDLLEHLQLRQCWCLPRVEDRGVDASLIIHHAADGREYFEERGEREAPRA